MGHIVSTYHDIRMKGTEFLRTIYSHSGLSIKPKTRITKIGTLKTIISAYGLNPEEVLTKEALSMPNRIVVSRSESEGVNKDIKQNFTRYY